ncbi:MAG: trypsin-like peptidase domain-containing protein [Eubacteriales bacterium]
MENGYFDNLRPNGSFDNKPNENSQNEDAPEQRKDAESDRPNGSDGQNMQDGQIGQTEQIGQDGMNTDQSDDGSYSFSGSDLSASREQVGGPALDDAPKSEYEVSYNSRSRTYSYTGGFADQQMQSPKRSKSHKGAWVCAVALSLVLSCVMGGACGYLVASGTTVNPNGSNAADPLSPEAIVQKYTTVIESTATNQTNSMTQAAEIAHNSVVIIDTFLSEQYEQLNQPSGSGSGVIWSADGYVVTCNHVVENSAIIRVTLTDGKSYVAKVVGIDAKTDLAVLKIDATESTLYPAVIRDDTASPLVLAESVIAIGNPLGVLGGTVTEGILSALERNITVEGMSMTLLQTSASVNSGNSGGGLFDINGALIGIVNAKSTGEDVEGLGFAIPISTVRQVANELITNGYVTGRPQIGVSVVSVTNENSSYIFGSDYYPELKEYATRDSGWGRLSVVIGVYLIDDSKVIYADGSDRLSYGDRITYVGGVEITKASDISTALNDYAAGQTITVTAIRNRSQTITVQIVLGQAGA